MEYIYMLSNVLLIISAILIKKKNKKMNFFSSTIVTIIAYLCYNTIIAYLLNIIGIKINLTSMSITNILVSIIIWGVQIVKLKRVEIQKYYINLKEIFIIILILIINIPILYKEFGIFDNFRFISTDATMHAGVAKEFYKTQRLVTSLDGIQAVNPTFLIGGYVNLGMILQTFLPIVGEFQVYRIYIIFDIFVYLLTGVMFYYLLEKYINNHIGKQIIAIILTIIYMLGYPLNSLITGFHYFSLGILEILCIIFILREYENNKITLLFLLNTGLLLTYNLFAPVMYIIELLVIIMYNKKEKGKILNKKSIINIIISLVIPGIIGICFFIIPRILQNIDLSSSQNLNVDGYIYINYITNIIIFIPFALYVTYIQIKNKVYSIEMISFWSMAFFTSLFLLGNTIGKISTYYYMKNYYVLIPFILLLFFQAICYLIDKGKIRKIFVYIFIGTYSVYIIYNLVFINISAYNFIENPDKSIVDIYNSNKAIMKYMQVLFPKERLEALEYIDKNKCIDNQNILLISNHIDEHLLQLFFNYQNRGNLELNNINQEIEKWNNGNYEYLIIFQKGYFLNKYKNIEQKNIIFEKGDVLILKNQK